MERLGYQDCQEKCIDECISAETYLECKKAFDLFDEKQTGFIKIEHAADIINNMKHSVSLDQISTQLRNMGRKMMPDIDFGDFIHLMCVFSANTVQEDEMILVFRHFDKDGDGFISPNELKNLLSTLGEEVSDSDVQEMMREADKDGDGKVSYKEFVCVMTNCNDFHADRTLAVVEEECSENEEFHTDENCSREDENGNIILNTQTASESVIKADSDPTLQEGINQGKNPTDPARKRRKSWLSGILGRRRSTPEAPERAYLSSPLPSRRSCPALTLAEQEQSLNRPSSSNGRRFSLSANASTMFAGMRKKIPKAR